MSETRAEASLGARLFPLGMSFNFLNAPTLGASAPQIPPAGRPMPTSQSKRITDRAWDGFDVYCGKFRFRRTSILTFTMLILALSCIGGATIISISFYRVADAIIETERVIDPALRAAVPLVTHAGAVMAQARHASSNVGALLNYSVAAIASVVPAMEHATGMIDRATAVAENMQRLTLNPTLRISMDGR